MKTVVAVVCVVLLCAAELAQSQGEPRCSQLIQQTKDTLYHNLPRNSQTSEMVEQKCVTRIGRLVLVVVSTILQYESCFSCPMHNYVP